MRSWTAVAAADRSRICRCRIDLLAARSDQSLRFALQLVHARDVETHPDLGSPTQVLGRIAPPLRCRCRRGVPLGLDPKGRRSRLQGPQLGMSLGPGSRDVVGPLPHGGLGFP